MTNYINHHTFLNGRIVSNRFPSSGSRANKKKPNHFGKMPQISKQEGTFPLACTWDFVKQEEKHITIVVVEDEEPIRMLAVDFLEDAGFEVMEACNADEALQILEDEAPNLHVLFTDVHMPGSMSGLALARHARCQWPWIAILVASGLARPSNDDLPEGSRFFDKPYDLEHVVRHIKKSGIKLFDT